MDTDLFIRNVKARCAELNTTPTVACKESGAGKSLISNMKNGEIPSIIRVEMLAAYLNCTVSDLLGEKKEPVIVTDDGQAKKLADALSKIGIDVGALTEADVARIAALAKVALDK